MKKKIMALCLCFLSMSYGQAAEVTPTKAATVAKQMMIPIYQKDITKVVKVTANKY